MSMTENEAAKIIEGHIHFLGGNWKPHPDFDVIEALKEGIYALERVQQYRSIIGLTPEDLKALEKDEIQTIGDALKAFAEWSKYKEIGTVEEFRELKEKATAKKPIDTFKFSPCPRCGSTETLGDGFCYVCGTER